MKSLARASLALVALCATVLCTPTFAAQIPLPTTLDLLLPDGEFVMVDGLKFDAFDYKFTGEMPVASKINVHAISDSNGNPGLQFQGGFLDLPGGTASDALIEFAVSSDGALISGAYLQANPDILGGTPESGVAGITETFLPEVSDDSLSVFDDGSVEQLSDSITFKSAVAYLNVQKDILLEAAQGGVGATVSFVDQTFTLVPEPNSTLLLGIGLCIFGGIRRRR